MGSFNVVLAVVSLAIRWASFLCSVPFSFQQYGRGDKHSLVLNSQKCRDIYISTTPVLRVPVYAKPALTLDIIISMQHRNTLRYSSIPSTLRYTAFS
jgi:hypothetical protein